MSSNGDGEKKDEFYDNESIILSFIGSEGDYEERSLDDIRYDNYRMELKTQVH